MTASFNSFRTKYKKIPKLFISYSHKDKKWKEKLLVYLKVFEDNHKLEIWYDNDISCGEDFKEKICENISNANIVILLVSQDFLVSDFIQEIEIPLILQRKIEGSLIVWPILLSPCFWKQYDWLSSMNLRPTGAIPLSGLSKNKASQELTNITEELSKVLQNMEDTQKLEVNNPKETAILLANVGNLDLYKEGKVFSGREITKNVWESKNFSELEIKLIDPVIKKIKKSYKFVRIVLFCTEQAIPHKNDTVYLAHIIKEIISLNYHLEKDLIQIVTLTEDPSCYNLMLKAYENAINEVQKEVQTNIDALFISLLGGTPAQRFSLPFKAISDVVGKKFIIYKPLGEKEALFHEVKGNLENTWTDNYPENMDEETISSNTEKKKANILINISNLDLCENCVPIFLDKEYETNIFEESKKLWESKRFENLELLILGPDIKRIRKKYEIEKILIFCTQQTPIHPKDTFYIAHIVKKIINSQFDIPEKCISIRTILSDPEKYFPMLTYYNNEIERNAPIEVDKFFVLLNGGTPQQKLALALQTSFKFGSKTSLSHKSQNCDKIAERAIKEYIVGAEKCIKESNFVDAYNFITKATESATELDLDSFLFEIAGTKVKLRKAQLIKDPKNNNYSGNLGLAYYNLGVRFLAKGELNEAKSNFEMTISIFDSLANRNLNNLSYEEKKGLILENIGNSMNNYGYEEETIKYYGRALDVYTDLARKSHKSKHYDYLNKVYDIKYILLSLSKQRNFKKNIEMHEELIETGKKLLENEPENETYLKINGEVSYLLGELQLKDLPYTDIINAKRNFELAFECFKILLNKNVENDRYRFYFTKSLTNVIQLCLECEGEEENIVQKASYLKEVLMLCKENKNFFIKHGFYDERRILLKTGFDSYSKLFLLKIGNNKKPYSVDVVAKFEAVIERIKYEIEKENEKEVQDDELKSFFISLKKELQNQLNEITRVDDKRIYETSTFSEKNIYSEVSEESDLPFVTIYEKWKLKIIFDPRENIKSRMNIKIGNKFEKYISSKNIPNEPLLIPYIPENKEETLFLTYNNRCRKKRLNFSESIDSSEGVFILKNNCEEIFIEKSILKIAIIQLRYKLVPKGPILEVIDDKSYRKKIIKILKFLANKVEILVFPEFSIPPKYLALIKRYSDKYHYIVIAGSHYVTNAQNIIYKKLFEDSIGENDLCKNICPIVIPTRNIYHIEKFFPANIERGLFFEEKMEAGKLERIFRLSENLTFGVLICFDYYIKELRTRFIDKCDILFVPQANPKPEDFHKIAENDIDYAQSSVKKFYIMASGVFPANESENSDRIIDKGGCSAVFMTLDKNSNKKRKEGVVNTCEQLIILADLNLDFSPSRQTQDSRSPIVTKIVHIFEDNESSAEIGVSFGNFKSIFGEIENCNDRNSIKKLLLNNLSLISEFSPLMVENIEKIRKDIDCYSIEKIRKKCCALFVE